MNKGVADWLVGVGGIAFISFQVTVLYVMEPVLAIAGAVCLGWALCVVYVGLSQRRPPHRHDWHGLYPGWKAEEAGERWRMCVVCGKKERTE